MGLTYLSSVGSGQLLRAYWLLHLGSCGMGKPLDVAHLETLSERARSRCPQKCPLKVIAV